MSDIYPHDLQRPDHNYETELALLRKTLLIKKATLTVACLILALLLGGGTYAIVNIDATVSAIRDTQQTNGPIARDTHDIAQYVKECQDPSSECSQKNREALSKALANIDIQNRRVSSAATACSLGVSTTLPRQERYRLIKACVDATLDQ